MAQDDMHVVMYKILAYLYDCMKKGVKAERSRIDCEALGINKAYWSAIFVELIERRFIRGAHFTRRDMGDEVRIVDPRITMAGVEFMMENSMMRRALDFLREIKDFVPGM